MTTCCTSSNDNTVIETQQPTIQRIMLMSDGYLANGKTILCRADEADRFQSLADIDKPEVRVMVNPGGLNEKYGLVYSYE